MVSTKAQAGGEGSGTGLGQVACLGACLKHRYVRIICNHSKNPNINLELHMDGGRGSGVWGVALGEGSVRQFEYKIATH